MAPARHPAPSLEARVGGARVALGLQPSYHQVGAAAGGRGGGRWLGVGDGGEARARGPVACVRLSLRRAWLAPSPMRGQGGTHLVPMSVVVPPKIEA